MKKIRFHYIITGLLITALMQASGCKKSLLVSPPSGQLIGATVFDNEGTAVSAIIGIYNRMVQGNGLASGSFGSVSYITGLSADELVAHARAADHQFFKNDILPENDVVSTHLWNKAYEYIYAANAVLEGLAKSTALNRAAISQLEGEARFIRAFCHFYLVNLWGKVPLVTTTDYQQNNIAPRNDIDEVYDSIVNDLSKAVELLNPEYVSGTTGISSERVRPNAYSARALLARVFLYRERWSEAEAASSEVISQNSLYQLTDLNSTFLKNSPEAIWQLFPPSPGTNAPDARIYLINEGSMPSSGTLTESLINSFESGDQRRINWIDSVITSGNTYRFPFKYKVFNDPNTKEYTTVMRLAEQYLIRAEARAHQENLTGAIDDINVIRERAGLSPFPDTLTGNEILHAVMQERRTELFTEWGHRWLDLKRTGQLNDVLSTEKAATWQETDALYPLPVKETLINARLTQNPGY